MELFKAHTQWSNRPEDERFTSLRYGRGPPMIDPTINHPFTAGCDAELAMIRIAAKSSFRLSLSGSEPLESCGNADCSYCAALDAERIELADFIRSRGFNPADYRHSGVRR
jgi:hypothetical protein